MILSRHARRHIVKFTAQIEHRPDPAGLQFRHALRIGLPAHMQRGGDFALAAHRRARDAPGKLGIDTQPGLVQRTFAQPGDRPL